MKLKLNEKFGNAVAEVAREYKRTRDGFRHNAYAVVNGELVKGGVSYINRTWETYPYQCAIHELCRKIAEKGYGKGTAEAGEYTHSLCEQADAQGGC